VIPWLRSWPARTEGYIWGLIDQGFSSATNFALLVLAGRALGAQGLGIVVIGITAYLLALGLQGGLLTTPLVASTAALGKERRSPEISRGLAIVLGGALVATLVLLVAGLAVPGHAGRGFLIVSPWLFPALVQDFWRSMLFQERLAKRAAANDASWAVVMTITAPFAWWIGTDWAIVGCWGLGALAGAALGFGQLQVRLTPPWTALSWWRATLWPFGRWLGLDRVVYSLTSSTTLFVLNGLIGATAVGGLRAAQSVFAPLSLIVPAINLPGLPATARALALSVRDAMRLSARLTGAVTMLALLYVGAMLFLGGRVVPYLFGASFQPFKHLAVPIGVWQLVTAAGTGFAIFLTAQKRGRDLLVIRVSSAIVATTSISLLAWTHGVTGAAWGYTVGSGTASALTLLYAHRAYKRGLRVERARIGSLRDSAEESVLAPSSWETRSP